MEDSEGTEFAVGDLVTLGGLTKTTYLNGRRGVVTSDGLGDGRLAVDLFPKREKTQISSKPDNVTKMNKTLGRLPQKQRGGGTSCTSCLRYFEWRELMDCSNCLLASYCSADCQHAHWKKEHKHQCEVYRKARKQGTALGSQTPVERVTTLSYLSARFIDKGDYVSAEKVLSDAIKDLPQFWRLHADLARVVELQGRVDEAVELMQHAVHLQSTVPGMPDKAFAFTHWNLAIYLERQGDYEQAITANQKVLKFESFPMAIISIDRMNMSLGNYDETEEAYRKFLQEAGPFDNPTQKYAATAGKAYHHLATCMHQRIYVAYDEDATCPRELIEYRSKEVVAMFQKSICLDPINKDFYKRRLDLHLEFMRGLSPQRTSTGIRYDDVD